jgi:hypothetical protein
MVAFFISSLNILWELVRVKYGSWMQLIFHEIDPPSLLCLSQSSYGQLYVILFLSNFSYRLKYTFDLYFYSIYFGPLSFKRFVLALCLHKVIQIYPFNHLINMSWVSHSIFHAPHLTCKKDWLCGCLIPKIHNLN